jgi:hypothetical protein
MYRISRMALATLVLTFAWATSATLAQEQKSGSLTGKWDVMVKGSPHGDMAATMLLKQDGEKVTGSFSAHGNEHTLEGTLTKGALELAATDMPADTRLVLSGKVQKDGTLSGYLSGPVADAKWTASRAKDTK